MNTRVDALRSTLDQFALDPRAKDDRPYLESILRRLGYSDVEIRTALGPQGPTEDTPILETPPRPQRPTRRGGPRVVEVEYSGPVETQGMTADGRPIAGTGSFALGEEGEDGELSFGLADEEGYAGDGEDFGDFDMSAVDNVEAEFDDWGEGGDFGSALAKRDAGETPEMSEAERRQLMEDLGLDPDDDSIVEFGGRPRTAYNRPRAAPELVAFEEFSPHEAPSEIQEAQSWPAPEEDLDDLPEFSEDTGWSPEPMAPPEDAEGGWEPAEEAWPEADDDAPCTYGEHTLYSRDIPVGDGTERIHFFSRTPPGDAVPAPLPDGYEVHVNDETGLPYLSRIRDDNAWEPLDDEAHGEAAAAEPRRRVRAVRVRAESREEAERRLREEGKNVRGSLPIDYEGDDA